MRRAHREPTHQEDQGQGYLVSVSDLMAGVIFLFLITLMIFALSLGQTKESLESARATQIFILETLEEKLKSEGIQVEIDREAGILRLPNKEQSINFPVGKAEPFPLGQRNIETLARVLMEVIPCFVSNKEAQEHYCNLSPKPDPKKYAAKIEVLLIEGHTDPLKIDPQHSRFQDNFELSGARAAFVHKRIREYAEMHLGKGVKNLFPLLRNSHNQQILSISGYADLRLLDEQDRYSEKNRRIDLRFVMEPPETEPEPQRRTREELDELSDDS